MSSGRRYAEALDVHHEGVLGTRLSLHLRGTSRRVLRGAEQAALDEIRRLESIFSVYRADSELSRWKRDHRGGSVSGDLAELLRIGRHWQLATNGVFNPRVGALTALWAAAASAQQVPSESDVTAAAARIQGVAYDEVGGEFVAVADCSSLSFNAVAKGLLIDRVADQLRRDERLSTVVVNIGGDLIHLGEGSAAVRIEDPARPYDNAGPLDTIAVSNRAVATSGLTKRGHQIGGRWWNHVIDPRTGWPVDAVASATVVADDCATADALATVASVLHPAESLPIIAALDPSAASLVATDDHDLHVAGNWAALRASGS